MYEKIPNELKSLKQWVCGYEGLYEVDVYGNVYSIPRNTTKGGKLKPQKAHGYYRVALTKNGKTKCYFVHRLVAEAFIPNPENLSQVNHKDECKTNNFVGNLEWCTAIYNVRYGTGIQRQSESRKGVPLSEERKRKISESEKGKKMPPISEETRKKLSEAAIRQWRKWREDHEK